MAKLVEFGNDVIEFPDSMDDAAIAAILKKQHAAAVEAPPAPSGADALPSLPEDVAGQGPMERFAQGLVVRPIKGIARAIPALVRAGVGLDENNAPVQGGPMVAQGKMLWEMLKNAAEHSAGNAKEAIGEGVEAAKNITSPSNFNYHAAQAVGKGLSAIPVAGQMAQEIAERAAAGDVAGAAGETVFNMLPFDRMASASMKPAEHFLRKGVSKNIGKAVGLTSKNAIEFEKIAPRVVDDLGIANTGREGRRPLLDRATAKLKEAGKEVQSTISNSQQPLNLKDVIDKLRGKGQNVTVTPTGEIIDVAPAANAEYNALADKLEKLNEDFGGQVPASEVYKQSKVLRREATKGGAYKSDKSAPPLSHGVVAARDAEGSIKDLIKDKVPGAKEALGKYADWAPTRNMLHKQLGKDMAPASINGFFASAVGRAAATGVGGVGGSLALGHFAGPVAGLAGLIATGTGAGLYMAHKSAFWNTMSAAAKRKIANAIKAGEYTLAKKELDVAGKAYMAAERRENQKKETEQKLRSALGVESESE